MKRYRRTGILIGSAGEAINQDMPCVAAPPKKLGDMVNLDAITVLNRKEINIGQTCWAMRYEGATIHEANDKSR